MRLGERIRVDWIIGTVEQFILLTIGNALVTWRRVCGIFALRVDNLLNNDR